MKAPRTLFSTISQKATANANMPSAKRCAGGIDRGRLLAAALPGETGLVLLAHFMLLDERGAGAEDGGKGEKETADGSSITAADEAGKDRRGTAQVKRTRYSYQRPSLRDEGEKRIGVMFGLLRGLVRRRRRSAKQEGITEWRATLERARE
jgi:hypothetical protein